MDISRNNERMEAEWFSGKHVGFGGMPLKVLDPILDFSSREQNEYIQLIKCLLTYVKFHEYQAAKINKIWVIGQHLYTTTNIDK